MSGWRKRQIMSKMSELALEIEIAIEEGKSVAEMIDMLQGDYGFSRAHALTLVNQTADLYREERGYEIY
jgi:hypothetical protein